MNKVIVIAGPTATGKTALSVALSKELGGEVVSADSVQIYKGLNIGSAKPTKEEMQGVPHHMMDILEPDDSFSVANFCARAKEVISEIQSRGKVPVVTGGTGLYISSLVDNVSFIQEETDKSVREKLAQELETFGKEAMHERLTEIDPEAAARLHPADEKRVIRALEVYEETGKTITQHNLETKAVPPRYRPVWIGLDYQNRAALYRRIDLRVENMLSNGLLDEIRALLALGVSPKTTAMQAIGYKEFFGYLSGACSLDEAAALCKQRSRNYAKRQLTWFRRNPDVHWLRMTGTEDFSEVLSAARQNIPFSAL